MRRKEHGPSMSLFAFSLLLCLVTPASGVWVPDGTALCTAPESQGSPTIVSDGAGGAIVTWEDTRNGWGDIFAQRVDASGIALWTADGVAICTADFIQQTPTIASDGAGGAIIAWSDERLLGWGVYAQRIDASGTVLWAADGVALCATGTGYRPTIVSDGTGGAIVAWHENRGGSGNNIYAQRVDASGTVLWVADGVALCTASGNQEHPMIVSDGDGGAIVTWHDYRSGSDNDIYAGRVSSAGTVLWTADGVPLCTATEDQESPTIASDGAGGAIVAWHDERVGFLDVDIYAQRIDPSGTILWTDQGVKLCTAAQSQYDPVIVSDGAGGAVVAWADNRGPSGDIYAQRVDADGDTLWLGDGVPLCTATGGQGGASIVSDDEGSAIVAWQDNRGPGGFNIYVQRVDAAGNTLWAEDGVALCIATGDQQSPTLTLAGAGSAIVTWQDQRGGYSDIYAQRVTRLGNPGTDPVPISTLAVVVAATALASLGFGVLRRKLRHG